MNIITFLIRAIKIGSSFLYGSTGETITEKSGHLNLGIPGIMCVGASCGCAAEAMYISSLAENVSPNPIIAVLLPILAAFAGGALMGLVYSVLAVTLRANQNVTGLALTTLGTGVSNYMIAQVDGAKFTNASKYFTATLPFAENCGEIGRLFFSHGIMIYLAVAIAIVSSIVLTKTRVGLNLRAVGENPATADAAGISVTKYRYGATLIGSGVAGLGGLCYIMDNLNGNWEYTIDAIGWLAIALVIFTLWRPNLGILGSIVFGGLYIVSSYVVGIPTEAKPLVKMLPYVVTVIVLVITSMTKNRNNQPPESLGVHYFREER